MAQPMKLSILIGADASGAKSGGAEAQRAMAGVSKAANDAGASINRLIGEQTGLNRAMSSMGARGDDIAAYGAQLDALRARYNPMFATISRYRTEVAGIREAHRIGAISSTEMSAAISRERQATLSSIDAIKGRNAAVRSMASVNLTAANGNVPGFQTSNIAAQFQDIGVTAAMGMSPLQIALQQGTQLSAVFAEMPNPIRGVGAALLSLVSPVSLVTIGVVGLTAAAIQYFTSVPEESKAASTALGDHEAFVRRLREAYGDAVVGLRDYATESRKLLEQETRDRIALYEGIISSSSTDAIGNLLSIPADDFEGKTRIINDVDSAISRLQQTAKSGRPDLRAFIEALVDIENDKATPEAVKAIAKEIRENAKEGLEAQAKIEPLVGIFNNVGKAASQQVERVDALSAALRRMSEVGVAPLSDSEKLKRDFETALDGPAGATEAGVRQLEEAYEQARKRLANQNPFVSNTAGAQVPVPTPGQRPSDLDFDPNEEANKKLSAALEENAQKLQQQRDAYRDYITTQQEALARLELERSLIGSSAEERARSLAIFEAEQKMREMGISTMSREADNMRQLATLQAERRLELERQVAAYGAVQQAGSTMIDQLTVGTGNFKDRLKGMLDTAITSFQQLALANPLKNMMLGTNLPTLGDLFSGKSASPLGTSTGAMTVTAGTVMINGVPLGTGTFNPTSSLGQVLGVANNNVPAAANQNSALGGLVNDPSLANRVATTAAPTGSIEAYIRNSAIQRGIDPNVAVRVAQSEGGLNSWNRQSEYINAAGQREQSYGPFQMYMGGGLGNRFQRDTGLDPRLAANGPAATDYALDVASKEGWGAWYGARKVGVSDWEGIGPRPAIDNTKTNAISASSVTQANVAVQKLGQTTTTASNQVDTFGNGALDASKALTTGSNSITGSVNQLSTATAQVPAQSQGLFSSLFSTIGKGVSSIGSGVGSIFSSIFGGLFAKGGVFTGGNVTPFATGGVVSTPTLFPMSGGRAGVMGEAGPEAIMPLSRGPGGRLGVAMAMPRQMRQGAAELRLNFRNESTLIVSGAGDKELEERFRLINDEQMNMRDARLRAEFPNLIEQYRQNPWARYS